jgi:ribosomal protein S18 acetylase RimI-like enzyme
MEDVRVRRASPGDAPFLAEIMLIAGRAHVKRGIWEVILGGAEGECMRFLELLAVTGTPHLFHHSCFLVAEVKGAMAGGLGGYDPGALGYDALRRAIPEVARKLGVSGPDPDAWERSRNVLPCIPDALKGAWMIDSVATLPRFRRRGIAGALLEEIIEEGRRKGFGRAQINMYIGNTPAQRAYEKYGFGVFEETLDPVFEAETGSPGMVCLLRDI